MEQDGKKRLEAARFALQTVEDQQGVRSYRNRRFLTSTIPPGIYHLESNFPLLVVALKKLVAKNSWIAVAGIKNLGWEAAGGAGVPLERLVVVECGPEQAAVVLSTLLEGFGVVVVGDLVLRPAQQRTLAARARKLERSIITTRPWPVVSAPLPSLLMPAASSSFGLGNVV